MPRHGTLVDEGLNAMVHQHFFSARLDLDVDGAPRTRSTRSRRWRRRRSRNPYGNAFETVRTPVRRESEAARDVNPLAVAHLVRREREQAQRLGPADRPTG